MPTDDELLETAFKTPTGSKLLSKFQDLQQAVTKEQEARRMAGAQYGADLQKQAAQPRRTPEIVIIAGNGAQAEDHCRRMNIHPFDAVIAKSVDRIRGIESFDVALVGTWYRRDDLADLFGVIQASVMTRKLRGDDDVMNDARSAGTGANMQGPSTQQTALMPSTVSASGKSFRP